MYQLAKRCCDLSRPYSILLTVRLEHLLLSCPLSSLSLYVEVNPGKRLIASWCDFIVHARDDNWPHKSEMPRTKNLKSNKDKDGKHRKETKEERRARLKSQEDAREVRTLSD